MIALTHVPSPHMEQCQLTFVGRTTIDYARALRQHEEYCRMLHHCGATVHTLDVHRELPDCVFVEDTAIVLDEVAVLASMGTESRRAEPAGLEPELRKYREVHHVELPATIEGGDIVRVGRTLFAGLSSRTNPAGVAALEDIVRRFGYRVLPVPIRQCLHLKTACTALPDDRLLVNPAWLDLPTLRGFDLVPVPEAEPMAADVALVDDNVCASADYPRTAELIRELGFTVHTIDLSEFAKAEGGVTCLSLLFREVESA